MECAFGEIDGRLGTLWLPLRLKLAQNQKVIDAALRLYNFIFLMKLKTGVRSTNSRKFDFEDEVLELMPTNSNEIFGFFGYEINKDN